MARYRQPNCDRCKIMPATVGRYCVRCHADLWQQQPVSVATVADNAEAAYLAAVARKTAARFRKAANETTDPGANVWYAERARQATATATRYEAQANGYADECTCREDRNAACPVCVTYSRRNGDIPF